ncbi:MAG: hypothetical protein IPP46_06525 [Bacteroidetes bacterium]|nr:hypothetical protein [Bacteroidota bacterium]
MVYALTATTLIVLLIGVLLWQEIKDSKLQLLVMLLIASLIADISSLVTIHYFKSNIISYNLFTLVETPLVLFLIGSWISPSKFSNLIHYLSAAFFLFWLFENIFITGFYSAFADYSVLLGGIIVLFVNIIYLYKLSLESYTPVVHLPQFWISASFLIYYSVSTILLTTMGITQSAGPQITNMMSNFHIIVHILTTLLLLKAFRCLPKPSTSLQ